MADDVATRLVEVGIDMRQARSNGLPKVLFSGELAWDMLLHLFLADARGERVTTRCVIRRSKAYEATAQRWLKFLAEEQLVLGDGDGNLDHVLTLSPTALHAIEEWAHAMGERVQAALCPADHPVEQ